MNKVREISAALLGIMVAIIIWLTLLGRESQVGNMTFFQPFHSFISIWKSIQRNGISGNFLGNIILFIPIGGLFPIVTTKRKLYLATAVGFSFSVFIEFMQYLTSRGCFDPDDIILNTLGTVVGFTLYRCTKKLIG